MKLWVSRRELLGRAVVIVRPQIARPVHHQAGIAGDRAHHRLVAAVGVGIAAQHRDARAERGLAVGRGKRDEARGVIGLLGEQQGIDPAVVVGPREARAITRPDGLLVGS